VKSELTESFLTLFHKLPQRIQRTARKNYQLWKENQHHPGLEFKKLQTVHPLYSVRVGIGWRAIGVLKDENVIVWFWIGSHSEYNKLIANL
jgi:hypothetical protein